GYRTEHPYRVRGQAPHLVRCADAYDVDFHVVAALLDARDYVACEPCDGIDVRPVAKVADEQQTGGLDRRCRWQLRQASDIDPVRHHGYGHAGVERQQRVAVGGRHGGEEPEALRHAWLPAPEHGRVEPKPHAPGERAL